MFPRSGGSKPGMSNLMGDIEFVELAELSGIVEYKPDEYTISVLAGTPIHHINQTLAENGQYLPFDPLLGERGATIGGSVASGLNGPGSYRFGGIRDFILGIRFINASGTAIWSGARVVKNAAGFDLPKLMIGSMGRLGILVEITFKVFPSPAFYSTITRRFSGINEAVDHYSKFFNNQLDLEALDLAVHRSHCELLARIGGFEATIEKRTALLHSMLEDGEEFTDEEEMMKWSNAKNLSWVPEGWRLFKVPLHPSQISEFEKNIGKFDLREAAERRYSSGGNLVFVGLEPNLEPLQKFSSLLNSSGLEAVKILDSAATSPEDILLGSRKINPFLMKVKSALDPQDRFLEF